MDLQTVNEKLGHAEVVQGMAHNLTLSFAPLKSLYALSHSALKHPWTRINTPMDSQTVYEKLGHAEVVQVSVDGNPASNPKAAQEFRAFADTYFSQFK